LGLLTLLVVGTFTMVYAAHFPITICHATGSASNPYVTITVDDQAALNGHIHHQDDIIPAPDGGCPTGYTETPQPTATEATPTEVDPTTEPTNTLAPTNTVNPTFTSVPPTKEATPTMISTRVSPTDIVETNVPYPTQTKEPRIVSSSLGRSCSMCCPYDKSLDIQSVSMFTTRFSVGTDNVTSIKIDTCCYAVVYVNYKLTYHINLAGWVVEYK
jgi:hypothetical protein